MSSDFDENDIKELYMNASDGTPDETLISDKTEKENEEEIGDNFVLTPNKNTAGRMIHGYWDRYLHPERAGKFHKRSASKDAHGWTGWSNMERLCLLAKINGDKKFPPSGIRDAALLATLFLGGFRRQELSFKNIIYKDRYATNHRFNTGLIKNDDSIKIFESEWGQKFIQLRFYALKKFKYYVPSGYTNSDVKLGLIKRLPERVLMIRMPTFPYNEPLVKYFLDYYNTVPDNKPLFPMSASNIYKIVTHTSSTIFPHWFRAERAMQLVQEYKFDFYKLRAFYLWQSIETTLSYVNPGSESYMRSMAPDLVPKM